MNIKIIIIIICIILIVIILGILTNWKFFIFKDNYSAKEIKQIILQRSDKTVSNFSKTFKTIIEDDNEFYEAEINL